MSPVIARAAIRNAAATGRRQFSVVRSLRSFARSFEPHVFQRLPVAGDAQAPDYGRLIKRSGKTIAIYFPVAFTILGWPMIAKKGLDGHVH
ncbi:uncharacterized protein SPSK_10061 [Sporothrix schenckii 1099-18]|uniref:Uncharacterized protein n=1 Tax=Sporothrix schenckii 1099-18 TaxID=1397361 RepID=A0A0F2M4M8_SPOSC|nr:uncharacterized protein SPSK_10061 [Sporothrix schenckii 1099-18]KJR84572.1 hypothetical protein SPSK_10061 [Sporothrix schenckii 1099-18]